MDKPTQTLRVFIKNDLTREFINKPQLASMRSETDQVDRISHVEPVSWFYRILFHAIRTSVRDDSWAAQWTRGWRVPWRARMFECGTILGPFINRQKAIEAEVKHWENQQR